MAYGYDENGRPVADLGQTTALPHVQKTAERDDPNELRRAVVDRIGLACRRVSRAIDDRLFRREQPLAPHVVLFYYNDPTSRGESGPLRIASRLFVELDHPIDSAEVMARLHDLARRYHQAGGCDPRRQLATRVESMSSAAEYVGAGIATLEWADEELPVTFAGGRPFRAVVVLIDGSRLVAQFDGNLGSMTVFSTHTLDVGTRGPTRTWAWMPSHMHSGDSIDARTIRAASGLHEFLAGHQDGGRRGRRLDRERRD